MRATQVFMGADLRLGHEGLAKVAKDNQVDVTKLETGEMVAFINTSRDRLKVFTYNGVVAYIRFTGESRRSIDIEAINEMARAFRTDGTVSYAKGLRTALEKRLSKRGKFTDLEVL